jgi:hypothetical protein
MSKKRRDSSTEGFNPVMSHQHMLSIALLLQINLGFSVQSWNAMSEHEVANRIIIKTQKFQLQIGGSK